MTWKWADDSWLSKCSEFDKLTHAGGSALLTNGLACILSIWLNRLGQVLLAGVLAFLVGLALEIYQAYREDGFSWRDLVADIIGIWIATWAIIGGMGR